MTEPIFFIGVPRSGTSFIYEIFSKHEDLGWISNYQNRLRKFASVSLLNRAFDNAFIFKMGSRKDSNKMTSIRLDYPKPTEPYIIWNALSGIDFSMDFLLGVRAKEDAKLKIKKLYKNVLYYQGKKKMVTKFTGPSRIEYIKSIFPNAKFVHIVRDARAVTQSLLDVDFWKNGEGYNKLWWKNGQPSKDLEQWEAHLGEPYLLAAFQIRNIIEKTVLESKGLHIDNFLEVKYEEFLKEPQEQLKKLHSFCSLNNETRSYDFISIRKKDSSLKYKERFSKKQIEMLNQILEPVLLKYKYI